MECLPAQLLHHAVSFTVVAKDHDTASYAAVVSAYGRGGTLYWYPSAGGCVQHLIVFVTTFPSLHASVMAGGTVAVHMYDKYFIQWDTTRLLFHDT